MYVGDYDDRFPLQDPGTNSGGFGNNIDNYADTQGVAVAGAAGGCAGNGNGNVASWANGTQPYLKNRQVMVCPSSKPTPCTGTQSIAPTRISATSYAYNGLMGSVLASTITTVNMNPPPVQVLAGVQKPAEVIQVHERDNMSTSRSQLFPRWASSQDGWYDYSNFVAGNETHFDGKNLLFADGHAKWLRDTSLKTGLTPSGYQVAPSCRSGDCVKDSNNLFNPYKD